MAEYAPTKNLPIGFEKMVDSFESFVALYPDEIDKEVLDAMRNQFRIIRSKSKINYPPPLIRVRDNGQFELETND